MAEEKNGKSGNWKEVLGWIAAIIVVLIFFMGRKRRTVNRLIETFQKSPITGVLILVVAIVLTIGITVLRRKLQNRKK